MTSLKPKLNSIKSQLTNQNSVMEARSNFSVKWTINFVFIFKTYKVIRGPISNV
jgi:hypothetical protein